MKRLDLITTYPFEPGSFQLKNKINGILKIPGLICQTKTDTGKGVAIDPNLKQDMPLAAFWLQELFAGKQECRLRVPFSERLHQLERLGEISGQIFFVCKMEIYLDARVFL